MKLTRGDMDCIPRFYLTDLISHLHAAPTALNDVDLFHGIHMADEYFTGGNVGMGKKHKGLKMTGIQNHVSHATAVGPIASRFHFGVLQVAAYHRFILSFTSSFR